MTSVRRIAACAAVALLCIATVATAAASDDRPLSSREIAQLTALLRGSLAATTGPAEYRELGDGWHLVAAPLPEHARGPLSVAHPNEAGAAEAAAYFLFSNGVLNTDPVLPVVGTLSAILDLPNYRFWALVFNNGSSAGSPKVKFDIRCASKKKKSSKSGALPPGFVGIYVYIPPSAFGTANVICTEKATVDGGTPSSLTTQFVLLP